MQLSGFEHGLSSPLVPRCNYPCYCYILVYPVLVSPARIQRPMAGDFDGGMALRQHNKGRSPYATIRCEQEVRSVKTIHYVLCSFSRLMLRNLGDLARIGPNWLLTSDPDIIRYMSAAKYKHRKSTWYASLQVDPFLHSVFTETSLEKHDRLRTKVQPGVCSPILGLRLLANSKEPSSP